MTCRRLEEIVGGWIVATEMTLSASHQAGPSVGELTEIRGEVPPAGTG